MGVLSVSCYTAFVSTLAVLPTQLYRAADATADAIDDATFDALPLLLQGPAELSRAYLLAYLHCTSYLFLPLLAALISDLFSTNNNFVRLDVVKTLRWSPGDDMAQLARFTAYTLIGLVGYKLSLSSESLLVMWYSLLIVDGATPALKYLAVLFIPCQMVCCMLHTLLMWGITLSLMLQLRAADDATGLLLGPVLLLLSFKGYFVSEVYKIGLTKKATVVTGESSDSDCDKNED